MSAAVLVGVGLLGGVGALLRFALDGAVSARVGRAFPCGTLSVNVIGSFALGVIAGLVVGADGYSLAATGLVGALSTFSTWALESHRLGEDGQLGRALANFAVSLALGLAAVWAGRHLGLAL